MRIRTAIAVATLAVTMSACAVWRGQESAAEYVSDAAITSAVKSKLAVDKSAPAIGVNVDTMNGMVQLSGFTRTQAEKDNAAAIARQTKGVKSVRNDIIVRP